MTPIGRRVVLTVLLAMGVNLWCWAGEQAQMAPTKDTYIVANRSTASFGGENNLVVDNKKSQTHALIGFTLPSDATASVKSANLSLFCSSGDPADLDVYLSTRSWTESSTWSSMNNGGEAGALQLSFSSACPSAHVLNLKPAVQSWIRGISSNNGITVISSARAASKAEAYFYSRESATNPPSLQVNLLRDVTGVTLSPGISELNAAWQWPTQLPGWTYSYTGVLVGSSLAPVDGTTYDEGQSGVIARTTSSSRNTAPILENGDAVTIPAGTSITVNPFSYTLYTYDSGNLYSSGKPVSSSQNYTFTTLTGGGAQKWWSYKTSPGTQLAAPSTSDLGVVVYPGADLKLHVMNWSTGAKKFTPGTSDGTPGYIGGHVTFISPVIPGMYTSHPTCRNNGCDVVYVGDDFGYVSAFRADTGARLWKSAASYSNVQAVSVQVKAFSNTSYTLPQDIVIFGTRNGSTRSGNRIVALNGDTGAEVWNVLPGNLDIVTSQPSIDYSENAVWISSWGGSAKQPSIWKLNTVNGASKVATTLTTAGRDLAIGLAPNYDMTVWRTTFLYSITSDGVLIAVDAATGNVVATTAIPNATGGVGTVFAVDAGGGRDLLYFSTRGSQASDSAVHARTFNRTSRTFAAGWDFTLAQCSAPVPSSFPDASFLYVGDGQGNLNKISTGTPAIVDSRVVNPGRIVGDPTIDIVNNKIYVGDSSGRIYSFEKF